MDVLNCLILRKLTKIIFFNSLLYFLFENYLDFIKKNCVIILLLYIKVVDRIEQEN